MKRKLHENIIELLKNYLPQMLNESFERERQEDKVIIWIVGLATGSIALILYNSEKLNIVSSCNLKSTVIFLLLTIINGIIYRSLFYYIEQFQALKFGSFLLYCEGVTANFNGPRTIDEILKKRYSKLFKRRYGVRL